MEYHKPNYFLENKESVIVDYLKSQYILRDDLSLDLENKFLFLKNSSNSKKVVILSGGGSGHEPAHSGFVCDGMLNGAICGEIFSSPTYKQIINSIESVYNEAGVILLVKNYTGDKINFRYTKEILSLKKYRIEIVLVHDDISLSNDTKIGARGLVGSVLIYKIMGELSRREYSIDDILKVGNHLKNFVHTIGASFGRCSIPFGNLEISKYEEIELGLGIHGEKGSKTIVFKNISSLILDILCLFKEKHCFDDLDNNSVIIIINNLGNCTELELNAINYTLFNLIQRHFCNIRIERVILGKLMTSLDMKGFSLSIFNLTYAEKEFPLKLKDSNLIQLLDEKVTSPHWNIFRINPLNINNLDNPISNENPDKNIEISNIKGFFMNKLLHKLFLHLMSYEDYLNNLDKIVGDGDLGSNVKTACSGLLESVLRYDFEFNLKDSFFQLGSDIGLMFGGTSGPLYSMFLIKGSLKLKNLYSENTEIDFINAFIEGTKAIQIIGEANLGDRTILDLMIPISEYLKTNNLNNSLINRHEFKNLIDQTLENIINLKAKLGRSSYLNGFEIGKKEPGCELVALWLNFIIDNI